MICYYKFNYYYYATKMKDLSLTTKNFSSKEIPSNISNYLNESNLEQSKQTEIIQYIKNLSSSSTSKLPNTNVMAKELIKNHLSNYKFDDVSKSWFEYNEKGIWVRLNNNVSTRRIFNLLDNYPSLSKRLTLDYAEKVKSLIEVLIGEDMVLLSNNSINNGLIPFKNGVLDTKTKELLPYSKEFYFTHQLNIEYDPNAKLSIEMMEYLARTASFKSETLNVLRSFIQCILLRDNKYQVALYLWGPGGSGKSTFEKLMMSLIGNQYSTVMKIEDLNTKFGTSKLVDKALVLFSDVQSYKGDPKELRLLISGDIMSAEWKYRDSFDFQPLSLVIISSNNIWSPKDTTTGLKRRIIYISMDSMPKNPIPNFFNYNYYTGEVSGVLASSLPGLVNWALNNPKENLELLKDSKINNITAPGLAENANPLLEWINDHISYKADGKVPIGDKSTPKGTTLYPNYLEFCKLHKYIAMNYKEFGNSLLQNLQNVYDTSIIKKRMNVGWVITNIEILKNPTVKELTCYSTPLDWEAAFRNFIDKETSVLLENKYNEEESKILEESTIRFSQEEILKILLLHYKFVYLYSKKRIENKKLVYDHVEDMFPDGYIKVDFSNLETFKSVFPTIEDFYEKVLSNDLLKKDEVSLKDLKKVDDNLYYIAREYVLC